MNRALAVPHATGPDFRATILQGRNSLRPQLIVLERLKSLRLGAGD